MLSEVKIVPHFKLLPEVSINKFEDFEKISFSTAPLAAPSNLRITELQSESISLEWDELSTSEMAGPQNTYSLSVSGYRCSSASPGVSTGLTNTHAIVGVLCPYSYYTISVTACNTVNGETLCGRNSPAIQIQTPEEGK